jgi:sigma-B regulation protein RsbU (phosphoserine phosphatase)
VYTDITDRKRAEEELQAAYAIIKDQKERMESELNVGHEIQMSMIPLKFPPFPDHDEFSIYAALEPAREVGGDFYDYYFLDEGRLCFCVGDVSGKGVPAALFMAVTKTLIKSRAIDNFSTASILTHVNAELSADIESSMFVTVFLGILNIRSGEFVYTNAGHNPPYLKRKDGSLQRLDVRHGPMVGAAPGMVYREETDTMSPGDMLFMYTDGVTEERNADRELFSEKRLVSVLASATVDSVENAVRDTVAAVKAFQGDGDQEDDITVLAVQFQGSSKHDTIAVFHIMARNDLREIGRVNREFQKFAEEHGIPVEVGRKISILFDDLLSNVISYAFPDDAAHEIEITTELATSRLTVTISDDGIPFNPLVAGTPDTSLPLDKRALGGLGIHLIRNLVDDMSYQRRVERNVLTLVKHIE